MKHQFTTHDLIRYMYKELSYLELAALEKALKEDAALANQLSILKESQKTFKDLQLKPAESSLKNILNYSKRSRYETNML
jgi:hypothetical protein